ncbi:AraC family transcriptional regulator [Trinickia violacea]|uniref:AraC family transcriptional regulator n=1 Tax=Trinickia violacea TaxID=2571746 RepID=A0A4P8IXX7_9BURK|nr:AraC family transcriptional regulator [Trinickia violacea]QCP53257.1 AraC family transcriptional regulator [Trinickia violacea]
MNPVGRALWFIESHFSSDISLDDIASAGCVSRFHLSRAFGVATGHSIMRYVRARRLSVAAKSLSNGAPDILSVALEAGYGSHEAFTRAFREQFGLTPEQVRAQRRIDNLELVEPIKMDDDLITQLEPPRYEDAKALLIAGLGERYTCETAAGIPALWQRFSPHIGNVPGQVGNMAYGVCCNGDGTGNFDYICGVEVSDFGRLPAEFARVRIAAQRYAVFSHRGHISTIRRTWNTILSQWLPDSEFKAADAPDFERYDERFDPKTGNGVVEIWVPVKS